MSEIFRLLGFCIIGILAFGAADSTESYNKTNFLIMAVLAALFIAIGYLGDITDAIKENTLAIKTRVDNED